MARKKLKRGSGFGRKSKAQKAEDRGHRALGEQERLKVKALAALAHVSISQEQTSMPTRSEMPTMAELFGDSSDESPACPASMAASPSPKSKALVERMCTGCRTLFKSSLAYRTHRETCLMINPGPTPAPSGELTRDFSS